MSGELTHLDESGQARMVDVGGKDATERTAVAEATVSMSEATADLLFTGALPKGDALAVARVAGIQGAKATPQLVPLCHPLPLTAVAVDIDRIDGGARIRVTTRVTAKTGVEMEAMTGASVAALTLYDMIKGVERGAAISRVELVSKSGGTSGAWTR